VETSVPTAFLPVEQRAPPRLGAGSWLQACVQTLARTLARPSASFRRCPEPIAHGRVLGYLATLRLPPWLLLVGVATAQLVTREGQPPIPLLPIHTVLDPALAHALSTWLVLMVPVGLPLLYFVGGLVAHVGIALTGGAPRSIGATMRAVGDALGPALLALAVVDLPLYLAHVPGTAYVAFLGAVTLAFLLVVGVTLARTHQISLARGFLVALVPAILLAVTTGGRAVLVLDELPGLEAPDSPYYIP
jgi:hypothetical protein